MVKKISDLLVVSDIDNTLLTREKGIPDYNVRMIKKFQSLGGRFTVATGRTVESVERYLGKISLSAPAITYNGGIIYDFAKGQVLYRALLPESAHQMLLKIRKEFPDVGCEIMCDNFRVYVVKANAYTQIHLSGENMSFVDTSSENISDRWIKILFADSNFRLLQLKDYCVSEFGSDSYEFVMTNSIYFEILPKNITKGKALATLCEISDTDIDDTIVIGDYYNDVEILKNAGLSVCVDNAPDEIKSICHIVVPSCLDGGVGHLLAQIMESYT